MGDKPGGQFTIPREIIKAACNNFVDMAPERVFQVRYEDFTADPQGSLAKIMRWLKTPYEDDSLKAAVSSVRSSSVGKGQAAAEALPHKIKSVLEPSMRAHGYLDKD